MKLFDWKKREEFKNLVIPDGKLLCICSHLTYCTGTHIVVVTQTLLYRLQTVSNYIVPNPGSAQASETGGARLFSWTGWKLW